MHRREFIVEGRRREPTMAAGDFLALVEAAERRDNINTGKYVGDDPTPKYPQSSVWSPAKGLTLASPTYSQAVQARLNRVGKDTSLIANVQAKAAASDASAALAHVPKPTTVLSPSGGSPTKTQPKMIHRIHDETGGALARIQSMNQKNGATSQRGTGASHRGRAPVAAGRGLTSKGTPRPVANGGTPRPIVGGARQMAGSRPVATGGGLRGTPRPMANSDTPRPTVGLGPPRQIATGGGRRATPRPAMSAAAVSLVGR